MGGYSRSQLNRYVHFSISVPLLIKITCALPLFAALVCVLWSLVFSFEEATRTHCKVYNFLPTISSVTGGLTPERYIWQICIALHAPQRLMMAFAYYGFHTAVHAGTYNELYKMAAAINSLLHLVEVLSLVALSMITSTNNYKAHENLFISFMACAVFYMLLTIVLMRWGRFGKHSAPSRQDIQSLTCKTRLFTFHLLVFGLAIYLFYRHNKYCEPKVYSCFALCEYLLIISNIAYHSLAVVDFEAAEVSLMDILSQNTAPTKHRSSNSYESRHCEKGGVGSFESDMRMMLV